MARLSGALESVVRGVSEQVPQDRFDGQHTEQVNMVPDPVRGLARRHGSVTLSEVRLPHVFAELLTNTAGHVCFPFSNEDTTYDLLYRASRRPEVTEVDDTFFCYSRYDNQFLPVVVHDTVATQALRVAGVSAITQVGKFIIMAGNTYTTTWDSNPVWDTPDNKKRLAVWVRGGAYSRTFTMTLTSRVTDTQVTFTYKTPPSSYPGLLDVSDLNASDPNYQKNVNDRIYAYQSQVTKHIGDAAEKITPGYIAGRLLAAYQAAGYTNASLRGSTIVFQDDRWSEVSVDDDGDGTLIAGVGNTIESADDACPIHYVGKVVKVRPSKESPDTAFYLKAYPKDDYTSAAVTEVTWREGCATEYTAARQFVLGIVHEGTLYISDDLEWLDTQVDPETADNIPRYKVSQVGDDISNPLPNFFGKRITYLGTMQDRLVVGSDGIFNLSKRGEYFNFWRSTVLSQPDDDPIEMYSLGSEDDLIRYATPFNRDLILYGQRGQYAISGAQPLTPKSASIVRLTAYETNIDAAPVASGNLAFYATKRGSEGRRVTSLRQIQPAALSDNPDSRDISEQLDTYIRGAAVEMVTMSSPSTVLVRTDAGRNGLYLFNHLDRPNGERVVDAWHRWYWEPLVGNLVGISTTGDGHFHAYMIREGANGAAWIACERFTLVSALSAYPYLDALRPQEGRGSLDGLDPTKLAQVHGAGEQQFEGVLMSSNPAPAPGAFIGVSYRAGVTPTNPFPKDRNGKPISFGRMTLGRVKVTLADSGGCEIYTTIRDQEPQLAASFSGFYVGQSNTALGTQPVVARQVSAYVGGEVRECSYTIAALRWLPLTITQIEWTGQLFNSNRR